MNWMALVALHSTLTFAVVLLAALVKLVVWLATRQRMPRIRERRARQG